MKKIILKKGHLNDLVERMIKENTQTEAYDSEERKQSFKIDVNNEMHDGYMMAMEGLVKMAEQIGKLEIEKELHDELKKRMFMMDKHMKSIANAMESFQQDIKGTDIPEPDHFDITDISPNE
tara:strand:- start:1436 stop:1801 length:366 start_codon:yes stop_codon:yes gene_type:complete